MDSSLWFPASCTLCDKVKMKQFKNNRIKLYHNTIEYKEKKGCFCSGHCETVLHQMSIPE